jgi:amino acid transporter
MQETMDAPKLRRELSIWEAIGISLALMAPSMAANINPQGPATLVGRAVPLTFIMATVGVLLVAYTFVRLTQRFNHSGSVYGFVGATLNPRVGILAGWALTGTYVFYGVVTAMAFGRFASAFLDSLGVWKSPPDSAAYILGLIGLVGVWALAISPARNGTRLLLIIEAATVALILLVTVVVLFKLANGTAPNGLKIDTSVFSLPEGVDTSTLFLGVVFGFLSFAGFEAAATLGEEAKNPRRDIPKAILGVAIFGGIYFTIVTAVEVMGFGTSDEGVKNFIASGSLLGDLGSQYVASWVGQLITAGAMVSAFGCALACAVGAARLMYAFGRDGVSVKGIEQVHPKRGTPTNATTAVVVAMAILVIGAWQILKWDSLTTFLQAGVIGTLILLVVYLLATVGALKLLFFSGQKTVAAWEVIIPVLALLVLAYTLFRNVYPFPTGTAVWGPAVAIVWLIVGIVWILARSAASTQAGEALLKSEGLAESIDV